MKTLALATGMLLLAATVGVAAAGEPVPLTDRQLDAVNAGQFASISVLASASGGTPDTLATGMLLLAATVGVAAGEPVPLIDRQLDAVNAGQFASISILVSASGGTPGTAVTSATATASAQTTSTSATATANGNAMDSVTGSVELLP